MKQILITAAGGVLAYFLIRMIDQNFNGDVP